MKNALAGLERTLFWTLAVAAFAAACLGLAARAVDRVATGYEQERQSYAIVQVTGPEGPAGIAAAEVALAHSPLVVRAAPMSPERAAELLRQPGAESVSAEEMPELRLIEIELTPDAWNQDFPTLLETALTQAGVTGAVIAASHSDNGGSVMTRARFFAFWGAVLFAVVMSVIVALGARGLAARRREQIVVMADLGATRSQTAGRIADEAAVMGLYAGAVGGLLAGMAGALTLIAITGASTSDLRALIMPIDFAPIVAAPLVAALAAGLGARTAAGYLHGRAARLA
ncbi:FtsX-like permease family protein [Terricaulis sp.]|uniref:FtsX-like permease family protein n=1 Tax=Terricaulis sp. TaxID=2768686 RepID=UPI0037835F9E